MRRYGIPCEDARHTQRAAFSGHRPDPTPDGQHGQGFLLVSDDTEADRVAQLLSGYLCEACARVRQLATIAAGKDAAERAAFLATLTPRERNEVSTSLAEDSHAKRSPPVVEQEGL